MSKQALTLSIIIPVYNEESHLKSCLESIVSQTEKPDEVIIVDNNSTDASVAIAQDYPFVTVLSETKQGVLYARNTGFNATHSDIIGRIDADTILHPDWCKEVRKIFADKRIGAATGPVVYYDMPLPRVGFQLDKTVRRAIHMFNDDYPYLFGTNMAIRRSIWDAYKTEFCTSKSIHEDLDIGIHLTQANVKIAYRPNMITGMSSRRFDDKPKDFYRYISFYKSSFNAHGIETNTPKFAMATYIFAYFLLRPFRMMYDPEKSGFSVKQLFNPKKARKHPMDELTLD